MRLRFFSNPLFISVVALLLLFSCNDGDVVPTPPIEPVAAKFTIATSSGAGGSITHSQSVDGGQSVTITATAQEHYRLKQWTGDCGGFGPENSEITITASENCQIGAEFEKINYSITATSSDGGSVNEGELSREHGQVVSFTAEPEEGYQLSGWTPAEGSECPDLIIAKNKVTFTVAGNCSLEAVFTRAPRTITIEAPSTGSNPESGVTNGEITITPSATVDHGEQVKITATADEHYAFKGWSGSCGEFGADESTITITLESDCTISAIFEKVRYTITATAGDGGSIDGPKEQSKVFGDPVTFKANSKEGYEFSGWKITGSGCPTLPDLGDATADFNVGGDCSLIAVFMKLPRIITTSSSEGGQITDPQNVEHGDEVSITATAAEFYQLEQWKGDCGVFSKEETTISFTATKDCHLESVFTKVPLTITTSSSEGGQITDPQNVEHGDEVSITATADQHFQLVEWSGDCGEFSKEETSISFSATKDCQVGAVYEKIPYAITATSSAGGSLSSVGDRLSELSFKKVQGDSVTLAADPDEGYEFTHWNLTGTACGKLSDSSSSQATFVVQGNCELEAVFNKLSHVISTSSSVGGKIVPNQSVEVEFGKEITITATSSEGYEFKEWESGCGDLNQDRTTITFTPSNDCNVKAKFQKKRYTVTASAGTGGNVDTESVEREHGETVTVTAVSDEGYEFDRWSLSGSGCQEVTDYTYSIAEFKARGDCELKAIFTLTESIDLASTGTAEESIEPTQTGDELSNDQRNQGQGSGIPVAGSETDTSRLDLYKESSLENLAVDHSESTNSLELDPNGVTVRLNGDCSTAIGKTLELNGEDYLIVDLNLLGKTMLQKGDVSKVCTTCVTDMTRLIRHYAIECDDYGDKVLCIKSSFNQDISSWDVSNVTNMRFMFHSAEEFNQDISKWDVSNVTDMQRMFRFATAFNQDLTDWDVSSVTDMNNMFEFASAFNGDLSGWRPSKVTNMSRMFAGATSFNQDLSDWDVSSVRNMNAMFSVARAFNGELDWEEDTSMVTDMGAMFFLADSFDQDISSWDVSSVRNMGSMFMAAFSFNQDLSDWDVSNVRSMAQMFYQATSFNQDLVWEENTRNVRNMESMFKDAKAFNGDISSWNVSNVVHPPHMFKDAKAFNGDLSSWNVENILNMREMFYGATSFNQDISGWDVSNVTNMQGMFAHSGFNQNIGGWDVSNVTDMSFMFAHSPFNQDIGVWSEKTEKVLTMSHMFAYNRSFNQNIGNWVVADLKDTSYMFWNATSFNQDIGNWNLEAVQTTRGMFQAARSFNSPIFNIAQWNASDMSYMFHLATSFNQDISAWDVQAASNVTGMFKFARSFNQDLSGWTFWSGLTKCSDFVRKAPGYAFPDDKKPTFPNTCQ